MKGARGKKLADITLDAVLAGDVTIEDLRITPTALDARPMLPALPDVRALRITLNVLPNWSTCRRMW